MPKGPSHLGTGNSPFINFWRERQSCAPFIAQPHRAMSGWAFLIHESRVRNNCVGCPSLIEPYSNPEWVRNSSGTCDNPVESQMPFILPLLFLADLIAAALTFAITASVPFWRRSAITAPVFVFIFAPAASIFFFFLFAPVTGWTHFATRYPTALVILLAIFLGSLLTAYLAALTCRFGFQVLAPRVEQFLDLRSYLVLQGAILSGGTLSLLVIVLLFPNIAHMAWNFGPHWVSIVAGLAGVSAAAACILALIRLRAPEQYLPKPLPQFLAARILRQP
jgi:hypothetical protein